MKRYSDPYPVLIRITYRDKSKPSVIQYVSRARARELLETYSRPRYIESSKVPMLVETVSLTPPVSQNRSHHR